MSVCEGDRRERTVRRRGGEAVPVFGLRRGERAHLGAGEQPGASEQLERPQEPQQQAGPLAEAALDGTFFSEVYQRHAREVFGFIVKLTADPVLADDLTHETFLRAFQARDSYRHRGKSVLAWLVTIARNLVRDHVKSAYQRSTVLTAEDAHGEKPLPESGPEQAFLAHDEAERVYRALRELPALQRRCLALRFIAEQSIAETAHALGRSEPAVRALQYRASVNMRAILHRSEFSEAGPVSFAAAV